MGGFKRYFRYCFPHYGEPLDLRCVEVRKGKEVWVPKDELDWNNYWNSYCINSSSKKIRTLRAFRRYLKKHLELRGIKMIFVNGYQISRHGKWKSLDIIVKVK